MLEDETLNRQHAGAARRPHLGAARRLGPGRGPHGRGGREHHRRPARLELRRAPERLRLGGRGQRGPGETFPIYVVGQVGEPGQLEVEAGTTLLQAIALAGGLDRFAATKRIQLRRTDPSTGQERLYIFNYNAVERGGAIQSMITMREGDVIVVPERRLFE